MYCSQLVWKTYLDIGDYSVYLNSNNWSYLFWIGARYGPITLAIHGLDPIGPIQFARRAVTPDEIARDNDFHYYFYEDNVRIVVP